jgi:two-component SAPR family response regulator
VLDLIKEGSLNLGIAEATLLETLLAKLGNIRNVFLNVLDLLDPIIYISIDIIFFNVRIFIVKGIKNFN